MTPLPLGSEEEETPLCGSVPPRFLSPQAHKVNGLILAASPLAVGGQCKVGRRLAVGLSCLCCCCCAAAWHRVEGGSLPAVAAGPAGWPSPGPSGFAASAAAAAGRGPSSSPRTATGCASSSDQRRSCSASPGPSGWGRGRGGEKEKKLRAPRRGVKSPAPEKESVALRSRPTWSAQACGELEGGEPS